MKRSFVTDVNGSRIACDAITALTTIAIPSQIEGARKLGVVAMTAAGPMPLAECYPHEAKDVLERWTRVVFGGPERKVKARGPESPTS